MPTTLVELILKSKRYLKDEWHDSNPILYEGEFGIESDTRQFKIGDGVTKWLDLPYASSEQATYFRIPVIIGNTQIIGGIDEYDEFGHVTNTKQQVITAKDVGYIPAAGGGFFGDLYNEATLYFNSLADPDPWDPTIVRDKRYFINKYGNASLKYLHLLKSDNTESLLVDGTSEFLDDIMTRKNIYFGEADPDNEKFYNITNTAEATLRNLYLTDTLSVDKASTFKDNVTFYKYLYFANGVDYYIDDAANAVLNTLTVKNETYLENILNVDGDTTIGNENLSSNLEVYGNTTIHGSDGLLVDSNAIIKTDLMVDGNTRIGTVPYIDGDGNTVTTPTTLDVYSTTTFNEEVTALKKVLFDNDIEVNGNSLFNKNIDINGIFTSLNNTEAMENINTGELSGSIVATGGVAIKKNLIVKDTVNIKNRLYVKNGATLHSTLEVSGYTGLYGGLAVTGDVLLGNNLIVTEDTILSSNLTVIKSTILRDTLAVDGKTTLNDELEVIKATVLNDTLNVKGSTTLENTLNVKDNTTLEKELSVGKKATLNDELEVIKATVLRDTLTVDGKTTLNDELEVIGATVLNDTLNVTGATALNDTLSVIGATTLNDTLNVAKKVTIGEDQNGKRADLEVNGDTVLNGTLIVDGKATLNDELEVIGPTTLNDTLSVIGATTLDSTLSVKGNTEIGNSTTASTLTVWGATTLKNTLDVGGNTTIDSTLGVTGATTLDNTLSVTGATTLSDTLTVDKKTTLNDELEVIKATTLNDTLIVDKKSTLNDELEVAKKTTLNDELIVANKTTLNDELEVIGATVLKSTLGVTGATTLKDTLNVYKNTTIGINEAGKKADLTVYGNTLLYGNLSVSGATTLNDTVTLGKDPRDSMHAATKKYVDETIKNFGATVYRGTIGKVYEKQPDGTVVVRKHPLADFEDVPTQSVYRGDRYDIISDGNYAGYDDTNTDHEGSDYALSKGDIVIAKTTGLEVTRAIENWSLIPSGDRGEVTLRYSTVESEVNLSTKPKYDEIIFGEAAVHQVLNNPLIKENSAWKLNKTEIVLPTDDYTPDKLINVSSFLNHMAYMDYARLSGANFYGDVTIGSSSSSGKKNLTVWGDTTLKSTLGVDGNTAIGGTLSVTGATTLNNTLTVSDKTTLNDKLEVIKSTVLNDTLNVKGATTLDRTLSVTGATTLSDTLNVTGATTLDSTLSVKGNTVIGNSTTASTLTVYGTTTLKSSAILEDTLNVKGSTTLENTLKVAKKVTIGEDQNGKRADLEVNGDTILNGTLFSRNNVTIGDSTIASTLTVWGATTLKSTLGVDGNTTIGNSTTASTLTVYGVTTLENLTQSTASSNGALVVKGGVGIAKQVNISGITKITDSTNSTNYDNGALVVTGGIATSNNIWSNKNVYMNGSLYVGHDTASNAIIYLNNKLAIKGTDSWLRINDTNAFTSGIYLGTGIVRTDGTFQIGNNGEKLSATTTGLTVNIPSIFTRDFTLKSDNMPGNIIAKNSSDKLRWNIFSNSNSGLVADTILRVYTNDAGNRYYDYTFGKDGSFTTNNEVINGQLSFITNSKTGNIIAKNSNNKLRWNIFSNSNSGEVADTILRVYTDDTNNNYHDYVFGKDGIFKFDTLSVTFDATIGSNLYVNGNTILNDNLEVIGDTLLESTLEVIGATTLDSTLSVAGATTLYDTLNVKGATLLEDTLDVKGVTTLNNTLNVKEDTRLVKNVTIGTSNTAPITTVYGSAVFEKGNKEDSTFTVKTQATFDKQIIGTIDKAIGDGDGNTIKSSYASSLEIATDSDDSNSPTSTRRSKKVLLKSKSGDTLSTVTIPYAVFSGYSDYIRTYLDTSVTTATSYYLTGVTDTSNTNLTKKAKIQESVRIISLTGTTTSNGYDELVLGNNIATGNSNNKYGAISLFSQGVGYHKIVAGGMDISNYTHTLPTATGNLVTTADLAQTLEGEIEFSNIVRFTNELNATDLYSGAVQIFGGMSINKNIYTGGSLNFKTDTYTGSIIAKNRDNKLRWSIFSNSSSGIAADTVLRVYTDDDGNIYQTYTFDKYGTFSTPYANISEDMESTSTTTGALKVAGGVGIAKQLNVGSNANIAGKVTVSNDTDATATTDSASIHTEGGISAKKNVAAKSFKVADKVSIEYNSTEQCLEFIFA